MQSIKRQNPNIHEIFNDFDKLYLDLSEKNDNIIYVPKTFKPIINIFQAYTKGKWDVRYVDNQFPYLETSDSVKQNTCSIILCFSGGKDSTCAAQLLKQQGYKVYLYYLKNINKTYDEIESAEKVAKILDLPLYIDTITLSGKHDYVEHPLKNMIIANSALQYGIRHNITTQIAFGNYLNSSLADDNFEFCGGDDLEMWYAYNQIISNILPGYEVKIVLSDMKETLDLLSQDMVLFDTAQSCIGRTGLRGHWNKWVKDKYNIDLPANRCGTCYKCALEYVYLAHRGLRKNNTGYYSHCLKTLLKNLSRECGRHVSMAEVKRRYLL